MKVIESDTIRGGKDSFIEFGIPSSVCIDANALLRRVQPFRFYEIAITT